MGQLNVTVNGKPFLVGCEDGQERHLMDLAAAFDRYLDGLAALVSNANPELSWEECRDRAADIVVVQNGIWLTSLLGVDKASTQRSIARTEQIAFAPRGNTTEGAGLHKL